MAADPQHEDVLEGEMVDLPSRALVVPTVQLSHAALTPLLTVLAAQLSGDDADTLSGHCAAMQVYRAAAARVPPLEESESQDE